MSNSNTGFGFGFTPAETERITFEDLPEGTYQFLLDSAERKVAKSNANSWYIEARFKVRGGKFDGRTHIERYNVGNDKADVRARAQSDIANLADACGYSGRIDSMDPFFGKPFAVDIKHREETNQQTGEKRNRARVAKYRTTAEAGFGASATAYTPPATQSAPAPASTPQPSGSEPKPWG